MAAAKNARVLRSVSSLILAAALCPFAYAKVIYVDDDAIGSNQGTSWADAYVHLQDALSDAARALSPPAGGRGPGTQPSVEIRMAEGIYRPDSSSTAPDGTGDRQATFRLLDRMTLAGGYAGVGAPDPNARDIKLYETTLSGDLNGDDADVNDLRYPQNDPNRAENSYHVLTCWAAGVETTLLDGFTIAGGNAGPDAPSARGGGILNHGYNLTVTNCTFRRNSADYGGGISDSCWKTSKITNCTFSQNWAKCGGGLYHGGGDCSLTHCTFSLNFSSSDGGGLYNSYDSSNITDCTDCNFVHNTSGNDGGGMYNSDAGGPYDVRGCSRITNCTFMSNTSRNNGGGMHNSNWSDATLSNCKFRFNRAASGGGMYNQGGDPILHDCAFDTNHAGLFGGGGGICNESGDPVLNGCTLSGNRSSFGDGGGIYDEAGAPTLINCILSHNHARYGGGMQMGARAKVTNCTFAQNSAEVEGSALACSLDSSVAYSVIRNCILWDGGNEVESSCPGTITYSNIQGNGSSGTNIDADPCFARLGYWADANHPSIAVEPGDPNAVWIDGDYHLKSEAGRWDPVSRSLVADRVTSPCIDAGDPNSPICYEPIPNGGVINMGAYGGTEEASTSPVDGNRVPYQAYGPNPSDGNDSVGLSIALTWKAGLNAVGHEVYFGSNAHPPFVHRQSEARFDPGILDPNTKYYWRVDEIDDQGNRTTGSLWTFTTISVAGPSKGRSCFTGDTGVWSEGRLVPIREVGLGQRVNTVNRADEVAGVQEHEGTFVCYDLMLESGNRITVAENHYFMDDTGQWRSLLNLGAWTRLRTLKGSIGINSVTRRARPYTGTVYNLDIQDSNSYLVGHDALIARDY